ncbi:hypothetical protein [Sulfuricaulis sp.]
MLGGKKAWKQHVSHNLVASFQWINNEPAIVLFPARQSRGKGAYVICLSSAWKYANRDGYGTPYLAEQTRVAAEVMGLFADRHTRFQIAEVILNGLVDLISMPPEPTDTQVYGKEKPEGEVAVKLGGKTVIEGDLLPSGEILH